MLHLLSDQKSKLAAQKLMTSILRQSWRGREVRTIVWRPESIDLPISHNGSLWFGSERTPKDSGVFRFWNSFGQYVDQGNLIITVEINIPIESNSRQVAGFFAKDLETGKTLLMHDGRIGGGRPGIGKAAFLSWGSFRPIPVHENGKKPRLSLIVAPLEPDVFPFGVSQFVHKVAAFKAAAKADELEQTESEPGREFGDYFPEFSGMKDGGSRNRYLYESRHGDIVAALVSWQKTCGIQRDIVKSQLLDLGIFSRGELQAAFEVKTASDPQSIYTAIGQLLVHTSRWPRAKRFLVLPNAAILSENARRCLASLRIDVLTFQLLGASVRIR